MSQAGFKRMFSKTSNLTSAGCTCYGAREKKETATTFKAALVFDTDHAAITYNLPAKNITCCNRLFIITSNFVTTGKCQGQRKVSRSVETVKGWRENLESV